MAQLLLLAYQPEMVDQRAGDDGVGGDGRLLGDAHHGGLSQQAYRFAGITLAIVLLIGRPGAAWLIAAHRFIEVSIGIAVGLAFAAVWPADEPATHG
ncbi:MAG: hypothetical protein ABSF98_25810 [Bryobacteraceae bacterium]|jgi:hypothetical protein